MRRVLVIAGTYVVAHSRPYASGRRYSDGRCRSVQVETSSTAPLQSNSDYRQVSLLGYAGVRMRNVRFWPWLCENAAAETVRRIGLLQSVFSHANTYQTSAHDPGGT